jgi:hypothetical protein
MTKNSPFLRFRAIFMSYCPQSWVSGVIYKAHDTQYMFGRHDSKLIVFAFMAVFVSYCPQFWVFAVIYKTNDTQSIVLGFRGDFEGP